MIYDFGGKGKGWNLKTEIGCRIFCDRVLVEKRWVSEALRQDGFWDGFCPAQGLPMFKPHPTPLRQPGPDRELLFIFNFFRGFKTYGVPGANT